MTYLPTAKVTPTEQLDKIVKNFARPCLSQIPSKGLITSNETIQKLFTYLLYGLLLNIVNRNVKSDKKVNTLLSKKAYV